MARPLITVDDVTVGEQLINDSLSEASELFDLAIASASGATVGTPRGHVFLAGNDAATVPSPSITIASAAAVENDTYIDFLVALSAPSGP